MNDFSFPRITQWMRFTALYLSLAGCASFQEEPHSGVAPRWYSGFMLPELVNRASKDSIKIDSLINDDWIDQFMVSSAANRNEKIRLHSCVQYLSYPTGALVAEREYESPILMTYATACRAGSELNAALAAHRSFIPSNFIDKDLPSKLPMQVAMVVSDVEFRREMRELSHRAWSDINRISQSEVVNKERAWFRHEQGKQEITLVARGDFDGDGVEDAMFTSRDQAEDGSYSAVRLFQVTRFEGDATYRLLREFLW